MTFYAQSERFARRIEYSIDFYPAKLYPQRICVLNEQNSLSSKNHSY
uniref:Uncharacterized protein n=1 Tax=Heterorhabditis bacteriophora TaxID=37862 RepID=A0A1I7W6F8_HETBA